MNPHDAADRVAFFDAMYDGAIRAEAHAGHSEHDYSVAGHPVRLLRRCRSSCGKADGVPPTQSEPVIFAPSSM